MRITMILAVLAPLAPLALAGCNEHAGWNPNYAASSSPYGQYRVAREAALTDAAEAPPATIPVARPFYAPVPVTANGRTGLVQPPVAEAARP